MKTMTSDVSAILIEVMAGQKVSKAISAEKVSSYRVMISNQSKKLGVKVTAKYNRESGVLTVFQKEVE